MTTWRSQGPLGEFDQERGQKGDRRFLWAARDGRILCRPCAEGLIADTGIPFASAERLKGGPCPEVRRATGLLDLGPGRLGGADTSVACGAVRRLGGAVDQDPAGRGVDRRSVLASGVSCAPVRIRDACCSPSAFPCSGVLTARGCAGATRGLEKPARERGTAALKAVGALMRRPMRSGGHVALMPALGPCRSWPRTERAG